jgi:hypothetical protein
MTRDFRAEGEIPSEARRMLGLPEMRLVTYDRRGHRRLGAILDGRVVDLPDAVGHPAFPTTLEAFVQSSRGTVLDAARAAYDAALARVGAAGGEAEAAVEPALLSCRTLHLRESK